MPSYDVSKHKIVCFSAASLLGPEEIDRNNLFGDLFSIGGNFLVFRMDRVIVESLSIRKMNDKPGIERTVKIQNILSDVKGFHI